MANEATKAEENTPRSINERIRRRTEDSLALAIARGPAGIEARLRELDREWDVECVLETLASSFVLAGVGLGATVSRKWLILPGVVAGFLFQHAVQGWCPPLPVVRAFGVRTRAEIDQERFALKVARGDFAAFGLRERSSPTALLTATAGPMG